MAVTNGQPSLVGGYEVAYAPYTEEKPEQSAPEWVVVPDTFQNLPNFFPKGDSVDITTVDSTIKESMEGFAGGEEYTCTALWTPQLAAMHKQMVEDQTAAEKGYSWCKFTFKNRNQVVIGKFTTTKYLPTPENEAGSVDSIEFTFYSKGHDIEDVAGAMSTFANYGI